MPDDKSELPIKAEISAKAEFKAEVRTEIPAESSGRLVDALTDAIRPFTERRGLKADQIRLQREDVLIEIAKRTRERLAVEGKEISPVPTKFMVPFLEKASCEDIESEIIDLWAGLLASASTNYSSELVSYIHILSLIGREEATLLDSLVTDSAGTNATGVSGYSQFDILPIEEVTECVSHENCHELWRSLKGNWNSQTDYLAGCKVVIKFGPIENSKYFFYDEYFRKHDLSFEILEREKLFRKYEVEQLIEKPNDRGGKVSVIAVIYAATRLGIDLVQKCGPELPRSNPD